MSSAADLMALTEKAAAIAPAIGPSAPAMPDNDDLICDRPDVTREAEADIIAALWENEAPAEALAPPMPPSACLMRLVADAAVLSPLLLTWNEIIVMSLRTIIYLWPPFSISRCMLAYSTSLFIFR